MDISITFESTLEGLSIEQRNKAFKKLSKQGQRLEIAWDSLQLLLRKEIKGSNGTYWGSTLEDIKYKSFDSGSFQKNLCNIETADNCQVCARGALMLSQIRLGNELTPDTFQVYKGNEAIIKGFKLEDFAKMEREYENSFFGHPHRHNTSEKLANICCNILVNGNFNEEDKTNYIV